MRWSKLALNSALSPLSAITGFTFGEVVKNKYTRRIFLELLNEAFTVAGVCGVVLEPIQGHDIVKIFSYKSKFKRKIILGLLPLALKSYNKHVSGMYFDLNSGKKCDINYVNGVIQRLGNKFGVLTPANDAVIKFCHAIEDGENYISADSAKSLYFELFDK